MPVSQWYISIVLSIIIQPSLAQYVTERGNADGAPCHFPFEYLNRTFHECITFHHNDMPWCSTTYNYTRDGKREECTVGYCNGQWPIKVKNTSSNKWTSNSHQSNYLYQCEGGYQSERDLTVTCNSNPKYGRWNWTEETIEQAIKCERIECTVEDLEVHNGTVNKTRRYYPGDEIELNCGYGYFPSAPVCWSSGQWTYLPRCHHSVECTVEDLEVHNGTVNKMRRYYLGDKIELNCDYGYFPSAPVCHSSSQWTYMPRCHHSGVKLTTQPTPTTTQITTSTTVTAKHATTTDKFGDTTTTMAASIILTGIIIIPIISLVAVVCHKRKLRGRMRNTNEINLHRELPVPNVDDMAVSDYDLIGDDEYGIISESNMLPADAESSDNDSIVDGSDQISQHGLAPDDEVSFISRSALDVGMYFVESDASSNHSSENNCPLVREDYAGVYATGSIHSVELHTDDS